MKTLLEVNNGLNKARTNSIKVKEVRATSVQDAVEAIFALYHDKKELFSGNRKMLMKLIIADQLANVNVDDYTKRAIRVANKLLIDGYKVRKELLTLSQIENLMQFDKGLVNVLMNTEDDEIYVTEVIELIKTATVETVTKAFSAKLARTIKA